MCIMYWLHMTGRSSTWISSGLANKCHSSALGFFTLCNSLKIESWLRL